MTEDLSNPHFHPYVPRLVRQWLDSPDPEARHRLLEGSILFADISGFTKLSERLDRIGLEGAERVTEVIGNAFNRLLEPAYAYGGTLVKFGGDALLLFFREDDHQVLSASAALEMRKALRSMGAIVTPAGKVTLRMSQGVHSGAFDFFLVGSTFRELIMAGAAATHVHDVEGVAGAGQIVVSNAAAAAIPSRNLGPEKGPGRLLRGSLMDLPDFTPTFYETKHDLSQFVPTVLREPIARAAMVAEHRPAANAFIRFSGVDDLLEREPAAVAEAFAALIDDIEAATASRQIAVTNTDVYPDGLKIQLTAGAPVTTGEDEENILLAVRELTNKDRPLPLHIGVTRGPVFAGDVGTMFRRNYAVMGDRVNLAARLMSRAAPNQILATDAVLRGSRTVFETEELEPFHVKGKTKPIVAYAVGPPRGARIDASGRDAPFVGRNAEMARLRALWDEARTGNGAVVLIDGDTGSGKTRLVADFIEALGGGKTYGVICRRYRASTPYFASTLLLGEVLGIDRYAAQGRADRLNDVVSRAAPDLLPYLPLIGTALGMELPETQEVADLEQEFRKARLEESVVSLLAAFLDEPAVLWIDDGQWIDDASRDLFFAVAAASDQPWLLCLSGRGVTDEESGAHATTISVGPLSSGDAKTLVYRCTDDAPLPAHITDAIVERAAGNPMFLNQLIATSSSADVASLPDSIEAVVAARIDRLLPQDRNTLRRLSVLGTGFRPEYAEVVLEKDASPTALQRLADFLDVGADWVAFNSSLVHQAAYGGLPYRLRRELHGRVAESIERTQGGAALLAVHYSAAARWSKAWHYARLAGDLSKQIYANLEAADFYDQALNAARYVSETRTADRIETLKALGEVSYSAGLYERAGNAFRKARRTAEDPIDIAALCLKEAQVAHKRGRFSQGLRWTTQGKRILDGVEGSAADAQRARLNVSAGIIRYEQGRYDEAMSASERAIEEAGRAGDRGAQARAYYLYDGARVWSGRRGDNDYSWRALAIYEDLGDLGEQALVVGNLASFAYLDGRWEEAEDLYARSREIHLKTGNPVEAARAEENLGELLCDRGKLDEAEDVLTSALRVWKAADNPAESAFVQCQLGRVASRDGRHEEAAELLAEALQGFTDIGARYDALEVRTRIIENLVFQGAGEAVLDEIAHAAQEAEGFGGGIHLTRLNLMLGYALSQAGRPEEGLSRIEGAIHTARARGALYEVALGLEACTRLRHQLGRDDWDAGVEETWSVQEALGIVSIPRVPLESLRSTRTRAVGLRPSV